MIKACLILSTYALQKTGKAILAIARMRSSFLTKLAMNKETPTQQEQSTAATPATPETPVIPEDPTTPVPSETPTVDPLTLAADYHNETNQNSNNNTGDPTGTILSTHAKLSDLQLEDMSPLLTAEYSYDPSSIDRMSDTRDSGYEGRKSTRELWGENDEADGPCQPIFLSEITEETSVIEGDCCRLDVIIQSRPTADIVWYKDGEVLSPSGRVNMLHDGQKYSLLIRNVRLSDDAEYECRASNELGENSSFGELYVVCNQ